MSRTKDAKRSLAMRLLAVIGWLALKLVKIVFKVLSLVGSRYAKRKLAEIDERRHGSTTSSHHTALGRAA